MSQISINLLPDVRQARLRNQHLRRLVTTLSILVWAIAAGVVVVLLLLTGAQKLQISILNNQISDRTATVEQTPNLNEALTAQATLKTLPDLYGQRTFYSVFLTTLSKITPSDVFISSLTTDSSGTVALSGTAGSIPSLNRFYQSLKVAGGDAPLFSGLTLGSVSKDDSGRTAFSITSSLSPTATAAATTGGTK